MRIELECEHLLQRGSAHAYLAEKLAFPDYYGKNLDALFDCLSELHDRTLVLKNVSLLQSGGYGTRILKVLREAAQENPGLELITE